MEDLFEGLFALLVIVIPLLLKKKKKKEEKPRPGRQKASKAAPAKSEEKLKQTLDEVEQKLNHWAEAFEEDADDEEPDAGEEPMPAPVGLEPQYLQSEPMIAEAMEPDRLQETGIQEGVSRTDDAGCIGGSLEHDENAHHAGMDFHAHDAHSLKAQRRAEPPKAERVRPAVTAAQLRQAVLWKEILDAPVSMRE